MLRALALIGGLQLLTMVVLLGRTKVLALLLGPELVGLMAVIDRLAALFAQTASMALPFAAARFLPGAFRTDAGAALRLLRQMRDALVALSVAAGAIGIGLSLTWPAVLGGELLSHLPTVRVAFLTLPGLLLLPFAQNAIAARFEHRSAMLVALAHAGVLAATAVLGVHFWGLTGLYALYAAGGLGLSWVVLRRAGSAAQAPASGPREGRRPPWALPGDVWRFSSVLALLTFLGPCAALFVAYRVLGELGAEATGWFQAAVGISLAVRGALGASHPVFLTPNVNRGGTAQDRMRWANDFQRALCLLLGLVVPPLLLFPHLAVRLLYSPAFLPGAGFVAIFVIAETVGLLANTYQILVVSFDRLGTHVMQNASAQLLTIGVAAFAIERVGIAGAGLALLCAQVWLVLSTEAFLRRAYGLRLPARSVALTLYVLAALAACGWAGIALPGPGWGAVLAKGAVYGAVAGGLSLLLFSSAEERERIRALFARVREGRSPSRA